MLLTLACGLIMITYAALAGFSVVWLVQSGEFAAIKASSLVSKLLYWHGLFILVTLVLAGALTIAVMFGRLALGGLGT